MKIQKEQADFQPIAIVLESPREVRTLLRLHKSAFLLGAPDTEAADLADQIYKALKDEAGR